MDLDKLEIYVAWAPEFGTDVIGFKLDDRLYDVCSVVDIMLYDTNKEPYVESLRSMAFNFDSDGNRIKYSLVLDKLKYVKPLSNYHNISQEKIKHAYMLRVKPKNLTEHLKMIKDLEMNIKEDNKEDNHIIEEID